MSDDHSDMLDLAVRLAEREAAGRILSPAERAISDIMWIGTQVSPNGFDGWLAYTSCERIRRTLQALVEVGCTDILAVVKEALEIVAVDPERMTDEQREHRMNSLTEADMRRLAEVGSRFYDVFEPSMGLCKRYTRQSGIL
jgi:hypothetical protein